MNGIVRVTLKSLVNKKARFILTSLSVVLGVMFTIGVFIFTDSLRAVFGDLSDDIAGEVDLTIRSGLEDSLGVNSTPLDPAIAPVVQSVPGVRAVAANIIEQNINVIDENGEVLADLSGPGGPALGFNWSTDLPPGQNLEPLYLAAGEQPDAPDEFAVNTSTYFDNNLLLGRDYKITLPGGTQEFELVGFFNFASPDEDNAIGAQLVAFDTPTAEQVLNMGMGWDALSVQVEESADVGQVRLDIINALGSLEQVGTTAGLSQQFEVVENEVIRQEQEDAFNDIINIFQTVLIAFAGIILLVSIFVIFNTFTIVLGQRIKEIALMRILGATSRQIIYSIIGEALAVGLFSSGAGLGAGVGLAYLLRWVSNVANLDLPLDSLVLLPRTVLIAFIVGTIVTLISALVPALRSRNIPPMAALRDSHGASVRQLSAQTILGSVLTAAGVALTVAAFFSQWRSMALFALIATLLLALGGKRLVPSVNLGHWLVLAQGLAFLISSIVINLDLGEQATALGLGALILIIGINLISPVFIPQVIQGIGAPVRALTKVSGKLATQNAARSPRRTSTTAAALMIGLTLVSTVGLVASSLKASFSEVLDETVTSDWFMCVSACGDPSLTFSPQLAEELRGLPELDTVVNYRASDDGFIYQGTVDEVNANQGVAVYDDSKSVFRTNLSLLSDHIQIGVVDGSLENADGNSIAVHEDEAERYGLAVGDRLQLFFLGLEGELVVAAIFDDSRIAGQWVMDSDANPDFFFDNQDVFISATNADGVSNAQALVAINSVVEEDYPHINVRTKQEFNDLQAGQVDTIVTVINVFLVLALIVAFLGITNTLALSVLERIRELGLLRAVGMKRRQVLSMVLSEGVLIAVFGGLLGVGMGVVFGATAVAVIPDEFVSVLSIPWGTLVTYLIIAAVAGLLSALLPARRAGKLDVLEAIATE